MKNAVSTVSSTDVVSITLTLKNGNIVGEGLGALRYEAGVSPEEREMIIDRFIAQNIILDNIVGVTNKVFNSAEVVGIAIGYKGKRWESILQGRQFKTETIAQSLKFIGKLLARTDKSLADTLPTDNGLPANLPEKLQRKLAEAKIHAEAARETRRILKEKELAAMSPKQLAKLETEKAEKLLSLQVKRIEKKATKINNAMEILGLN